ncbi:hypothetical protein ALP76_03116 [Pseudomonas savastanoi pv. glycinea]|uniref:Uncharacterized protein n=1 Tax=Pseudomonas savastanoi pv. glycinea TaxID=318 RepID=A0A3M4YU44_PSESG|nr:hypothetical protein [Pseudomonas savastanoi pv. phaseolicola]RMM67424.1 hypothetical protein ALQ73_01326 [Pseudomonas savastanoi pv. glycinea]RMR92208.1 hypothetical protein ALP76_03116 [Pseudomonas savastanoi pv. glycinea]
MKTTHLQHHPSLGYLAADSLRKLPVGLLLPHECSGFVSFRAHPFRKRERVIKNLHAALRPLSMYDSGSYCFYGVQSDSPLAPLLLWDGPHFLNVGEKITVIEDTEFECYLDREYFAGSLKVIERSATSVTYKKVARLAAESDDDLDGWSFCLPVGPGDATVLNAVVKRILEIDVPSKEILLCGTPGSNFAYFDKVRIVGQDITAPPVQICKKKNRLALEAGFSNLVILHDRVFLPRNFGEIVRRFGPRYPLMTHAKHVFRQSAQYAPSPPFGLRHGFGRDSQRSSGGEPKLQRCSEYRPVDFSRDRADRFQLCQCHALQQRLLLRDRQSLHLPEGSVECFPVGRVFVLG